MRLTYMTSADFNQNPSRAKRQADERPLVITDHGKARYVLMRYEDFEARPHPPTSLFDALRDPDGTVDGPFEPERLDFVGRDFDG